VRVTPPSTRPSLLGARTSDGASQTSVRPSRSSRSRSPFDPTSSGVELSSRRSLTNSPQQYHWNGSPSPNSNQGGAATSSPPSGPVYDASVYPFVSQIVMPPADYFHGLVSPGSNAPPANEHRPGLPQMRSDPLRFTTPSTGTSDVYVTDSGQANFNQFTSFQQS
jgi:hypothetical protein